MEYITLLKNNNLKITPQRLALLEEIDKYGHIDIEKLFSLIKNKFSNISLATIYKNINSMIDCNILNEVKLNGFKNRYEINKKPHSHMVCKNCNNIEDITINTEKLISNIDLNNNYQIETISLSIFGICKNCQ
jgi:Fe2+ or Zn2+ uptake regulation protein